MQPTEFPGVIWVVVAFQHFVNDPADRTLRRDRPGGDPPLPVLGLHDVAGHGTRVNQVTNQADRKRPQLAVWWLVVEITPHPARSALNVQPVPVSLRSQRGERLLIQGVGHERHYNDLT